MLGHILSSPIKKKKTQKPLYLPVPQLLRSTVAAAVCRREQTMAVKCLGSDLTHSHIMGLPMSAASPAHAYILKPSLTPSAWDRDQSGCRTGKYSNFDFIYRAR